MCARLHAHGHYIHAMTRYETPEPWIPNQVSTNEHDIMIININYRSFTCLDIVKFSLVGGTEKRLHNIH